MKARVVLGAGTLAVVTVLVATAIWSNCSLGIQPQESASGSPEVPYSHNIEADGSGRFTFERVPPGKHRVYRITRLHSYSSGVNGISHYTPVEVRPGETSEIVIGGGGRMVVGRVNFGSHKFMPHWTTVLQTLAIPNIGTPPTAPQDSSDENAMRAYY